MIGLIFLLVYLFFIFTSLSQEIGVILGEDKNPNLDLGYAILVLVCAVLPMPYWVLKSAFIGILAISLIRTGLSHEGWYTPTVQRIDSGLCAALLIFSAMYAMQRVFID